MQRNIHILLSFATLLVALASSCDREAVAAGSTAHDRSQAVRAAGCDELVVPHGFALGWKRFNHRLSRWGVQLDHTGCAANEVKITHVGGIFSTNPVLGDYPWASFRYQRATSLGRMRAARVSIRDVVSAKGEVSNTATFDIDELGLNGFGRVVAIVEGIRYDTAIRQGPNYPALYNPGRGYTIRGLGVEVDARQSGSKVDVDYTIHFDTGPTPERVFMNDALEHARVGAELDVIIVATQDEPVNTGSVDFAVRHDRPWPLLDIEQKPPEEKFRTVTLQGVSGAPSGIYGLQRFHFDLDFDTACETNADCSFGSCSEEKRCQYGTRRLGEYLREISVAVRLEGFDEKSGKAKFVLDGHTSNVSSFVAYHPLMYTFDGQFVWVQGSDAQHPKQTRHWFETGEMTIALE